MNIGRALRLVGVVCVSVMSLQCAEEAPVVAQHRREIDARQLDAKMLASASFKMESLGDLPKACAEMVALLYKQPLQKPSRSSARPVRILPIVDAPRIGYIVHYLHALAYDVAGELEAQKRGFGALIDGNTNEIAVIHDEGGYASIDTLRDVYTSALRSLENGWVEDVQQVEPGEKSEPAWRRLHKDKGYRQEHSLLSFVSKHWWGVMHEDVWSSTAELDKSLGGPDAVKLSLNVRAPAFEDVAKRLPFIRCKKSALSAGPAIVLEKS